MRTQMGYADIHVNANPAAFLTLADQCRYASSI
jgi:hypothetical protein